MNTNIDNPRIGREFEIAVKKWFEEEHGKQFKNNISFDIGHPPKAHRFDVVSNDKTIIVECKCYTWTKTGNVPSAKMGFANQAVFYLSFIKNANTYVVLKLSRHHKQKDTLAEYYYRTNKHLLGSTKVLEYDVEQNRMREIN